MKTLSTLLTLLLSVSGVMGQTDFNPSKSVVLGSDNFEQYTDATIKEINVDATTLFVGFGAPESTSDVIVTKMGPEGELEWSKNYDSSGSDFGQRIIYTSDGGFALTGWTTVNGSDDLLVLKCDEDGEVEWTAVIGGSGIERGRGINETFDGDIIVAGHTNTETLGVNDILVVKLSANGEILWRNRYGGSGNENGWDVETLSDGSHIVTGNIGSFGPSFTNLALMKIESDGSLVWLRGFGSAAGTTSAVASDIGNDDNVYVAGYTEGAGAGGRDAYAAVFNSDGVLLNDVTIGGTGFDTANDISYFDYDGGPNFVIAGRSNSYNNLGDDSMQPVVATVFSSEFVVKEIITAGEELTEGEFFGIDVAVPYDFPSVLAAGMGVIGSTVDCYYYRGFSSSITPCVITVIDFTSNPLFSFEEGGASEVDETPFTESDFSSNTIEFNITIDCESVVGSATNRQGYSLKLIPNPALEQFMIDGCQNSAYTVMDLQGRVIEQGNYLGKPISVSEWDQGVYLIQTTECGTGKVLVTR